MSAPAPANQDHTYHVQISPRQRKPSVIKAEGDRIGSYTIKRFLGEGGMGVVYLAHQGGLERDVAFKFLKPDADPQRFSREAKAVAKIDHPHVVKIIELGEQDGQPYMVLEYLANGDLSTYARAKRPGLEQLERWLRQCLDGLQALHQAGMIHRDLKPQNIFVDARGDAKLGDLGLAKVTSSDDQLTGEGTTGTPAYLSPEQARAERDLDIRTDIYSLGATFYASTGESVGHRWFGQCAKLVK